MCFSGCVGWVADLYMHVCLYHTGLHRDTIGAGMGWLEVKGVRGTTIRGATTLRVGVHRFVLRFSWLLGWDTQIASCLFSRIVAWGMELVVCLPREILPGLSLLACHDWRRSSPMCAAAADAQCTSGITRDWDWDAQHNGGRSRLHLPADVGPAGEATIDRRW